MDVTSIALSGLRASATDLKTVATNVANATTPGYKADEVEHTADADDGGVRVDVKKTDQDVSIDDQAVKADIATYNFQANLKVLQKQKQLDKSLIDIQA